MTADSLLAHFQSRLEENSRLQHELAKENQVLQRASTRLRLGVSPMLALAEVQEQGVAVDRPSLALRPQLTRVPRT